MKKPELKFLKIEMQSMRFKMVITFFTVILFSIGLISGILYNRFALIITQSSNSMLMKSIDSTVSQLNSLFNAIETVTVPFIGNKMLSRFLQEKESDVFETKDFIEYVKKVATANPYIYNIELYSFKKDLLITSRNDIVYKTFDMDIYDWYNKAIEAKGTPIWNETYLFKQYYSTDKSDENLISISRQIRKDYFGEPLGVVNISIRESEIAQTLQDIKQYSTQKVMIINNNGEILSSSDEELDKLAISNGDTFKQIFNNNREYLISNRKGIKDVKVGNSNYIVLFATLNKNNWKLVSIVDKDEVLSTFYVMKRYTMFVSFLALILGAIFVVITSASIYRPISILKSAMQKAREGNLDVRIIEERRDEFKQLYDSFNSMIETINNLINELYEKKLLATEAELKALQSNINPHFLYNIFETMIWMIELGNTEDLKKMVIALSKFYRLVLSEGRDIITVKEAAEQIENYITVQKIRYKDMLNVDIDIDPQIFNYKMLNMLLQPIVENSIVHGIQGKSGSGNIKIQGKAENVEGKKLMVFTIEDDGIGIQKERLEEIKNSLENYNKSQDGKDGYYALKNINQRIKLHYGSEYGIDIKSVYGQGTRVVLAIPIE